MTVQTIFCNIETRLIFRPLFCRNLGKTEGTYQHFFTRRKKDEEENSEVGMWLHDNDDLLPGNDENRQGEDRHVRKKSQNRRPGLPDRNRLKPAVRPKYAPGSIESSWGISLFKKV